MDVAVVGLGYVGAVTSACLAEMGHTVVGVDVDRQKVDEIAAGRSPIVEPRLDELVAAGRTSDRLRVTTDLASALGTCDVVMVCVGTPARSDGTVNLEHVERVSGEIGRELAGAREIRCRRLPKHRASGNGRRPAPTRARAESSRKAGDDFGVAMAPEFLREGSGVADFFEPPFIVAGVRDDRTLGVVTDLFAGLGRPTHALAIEQAESLKYACNAFHALKITFANEIGRLLGAVGVDARNVMHVFCEDDRLNISTAYLRPGFAFGGSCLPKDMRALMHLARIHDVDVPMLTGILRSNESHLRLAVRRVLDAEAREVALLGLSFKPETDDLRESPYVELAETLVGKGVRLRIYDPDRQPGSADRRQPALHREPLAAPSGDARPNRRSGAPRTRAWPSSGRRMRRPFGRSSRLALTTSSTFTAGSGRTLKRSLATRESLGEVVPPARLDRRADECSSSCRTCRFPSTGGSGSRPARFATQGFRFRSSARRRPATRPSRSSRAFASVSTSLRRRRVARSRTRGNSRIAGFARSSSSFAPPAREGFDVIQACNPPDTFWALAAPFKPFGKRFVFDQHDLCPEVYVSRFPNGSRVAHRALMLLERATYAFADHVVATNESYRETAIGRGHVPASRVTVVRTGPNPERLRKGPPVASWRHGKRYLCAYLGVMGPQDGVDLALRAAAAIVRSGRDDVHFVFMGSGDSYDELVSLADELGDRRPRDVHGADPRRDGVRGPFDGRRGAFTRPAQPAQRRLDDEQDDGVHGVRAPRRRLRPQGDTSLGGAGCCVRAAERHGRVCPCDSRAPR